MINRSHKLNGLKIVCIINQNFDWIKYMVSDIFIELVIRSSFQGWGSA